MSNRHETERKAPLRQRPPLGWGWTRRRSTERPWATDWIMWAPSADGRMLHIQVTVTDLEIALAGRWTAAMKLKTARRELRLALVA